jgi:hypothetical protein
MINIIREPSDHVYSALISFAATRCKTFSFAWRNQLRFDLSAHEIAKILVPDLVYETTTNEWPGTQLIGGSAIVSYYNVTGRSMQVVQTVTGLYQWRSPSFPEDLAFYSSESKCWMASISHERDSWFEDESLTLEDILGSVPGIKIKLGDH